MAKRKTKKQKKKTAHKRSNKPKDVFVKKKDRSIEYGYSKSLIRSDLIKTLLISLLILGVELGLYFALSN